MTLNKYACITSMTQICIAAGFSLGMYNLYLCHTEIRMQTWKYCHTRHQSFKINFLSSTSQFFKFKKKKTVTGCSNYMTTNHTVFTLPHCQPVSCYLHLQKIRTEREQILEGVSIFVESQWRKRSSTVRNTGKSEWRIRFRIWSWYAT